MSTVTLDLDDTDKLRVHGSYASDAPVFQPLKPVSSGLSNISSIRRAEGESRAPQNRPQLALPKQHYMLDLLDLHAQVEGAVTKELTILKVQSKVDLAEIERLEKEKEEALRRNAEEASKRCNWGVLSSVAQYLAAGTSITVGLSLGGGCGALLLVTSGVLGLGNRVVRDTVGWQSVVSWFTKSVENQKKLVKQIEMGFLFVELGTGLAGGMGASYTGAFSEIASDMGRLAVAKKMAFTIQTASSGLTATSRLGKTFVEKRIIDLQVHMRRLDALAEKIRMEMTSQVTDARNMIDTAQSVGQELHKAVAASEIHDL